MTFVANKYPRVRAVLCLDEETARLSREHNDANILVLAGRRTDLDKAKTIIGVWLTTAFAGERHQRRLDKIREIEKIACTQDQTQIFIESPYRNNRLAGFLLKECKPSTLLCIACELSMDTEQVISKSINDWKTTKFDFNKKNCVFLIYH